MPKKRKTTKRKTTRGTRKEAPVTHELPGGFWRQIVAVLMIALSVFFVATWFGHGGNALNVVHEFLFSGIGTAVYFIPVFLTYLAVKIFRSENNRLAVPVYFATILMLLWISGISAIWNQGGLVGTGLNDLMLQILDQTAVIFIYIVLILVTALFLFQISPLTFFKNTKNLVTRDKKTGQDSEATKKPTKKFGQLEIKVNSGMPTEPAGQPANKLLKVPTKTMAKSPAPEPKEPTALVAVDDPDWKMPSTDLLEKKQSPADAGNIQQNAYVIKSTLGEFGIDVEMEGANVGPRVTQYTMRPPSGVNLSKILARDKELALNLAVDKIRIEAPIPGTRSVGVEIPNARSADVRLRGVLESNEWKKADNPLTFAVGKDISGKAVVANLAKMPHLLIAGTTGSGKSVMTNTLITSLLYRNAPSDLKLIIVDPKQVEMAQYNDIPHLLTPIITQTDKALSAMKWAVGEMERRYTLMAEERVKNIADYNAKMSKSDKSEKEGKMPYIVVIIDEMADLMMMAGKDLEMLIVRIAQKGRAAGIHLVLATQRPEVKVITGLIKANIPGRIAFAVGSRIDSQIMLDQGGAEKLLGKGDMLLLTTEMMGKPRRIQGAWASDDDINKVTDYLRLQRAPEYNDEVVAQQVAIKGMGGDTGLSDLGRRFDPNDPIVRKAVEISINKGKFSTAMLQTYLGKGHGFVSGLAIWFEDIGVIGPQNGNKPRDLLISSLEEFDQLANV
ncbi:MAG: DNA translocase FtsK 4TM domain-containing protein [Candidatus Saccharibacteria bacterium]|nr:DNA translocase FtsK 4TM domain-containing protein [Candidatus Saccharibacteria bacterium]